MAPSGFEVVCSQWEDLTGGGKNDSMKLQHALETNTRASVISLSQMGGWLLQMDNDPKHTKKPTMDHLKRHQPKVLPWPSQSPHLISIENLWLDLKRAEYARKPRNLKGLEDVCDEEWRENLSNKN